MGGLAMGVLSGLSEEEEPGSAWWSGPHQCVCGKDTLWGNRCKGPRAGSTCHVQATAGRPVLSEAQSSPAATGLSASGSFPITPSPGFPLPKLLKTEPSSSLVMELFYGHQGYDRQRCHRRGLCKGHSCVSG